MKSLILILSVLCLTQALFSSYTPEASDDKYQNQSGQDKFNYLSGKCYADYTPYGWHNAAEMLIMFTENANTSFDHKGDDFPGMGIPIVDQPRPKLIHSVGAIAEVSFISNGQHPYTGIFKGSQNAFLRYSLALKPTQTPPQVTPGIGIKFMRDNIPSANIFAMYSLEGQTSFRLFEHDLTNHVPAIGPNASIALKALLKKFLTASQWPTMIGLKDLASFDEQGNQEANPNYPFRLIFHPSDEARNGFSATPDLTNLDTFYIDEITGKQFNTLFTVYAQDTPTSTDFVEIGTIQMNSAFQSSYYGDRQLFLQHSRMEEDMKDHPEWVSDAQAIVDAQSKVDHFVFDDLPFNSSQ